MKKQNLINLVRYHVEKNDEAFASEVSEIAREFDAAGDTAVAQYLMELIANANYYVPQSGYKNYRFLKKVDYSTKPLLLPDVIEEDISKVREATSKANLIKLAGQEEAVTLSFRKRKNGVPTPYSLQTIKTRESDNNHIVIGIRQD